MSADPNNCNDIYILFMRRRLRFENRRVIYKEEKKETSAVDR